MKARRSKPPKRTVAAMAMLSFAAAFLVMFFSPFDMYLNNPTGFVVGWKFLLPALSLITFGTFFCIFAALLMAWHRRFWATMGVMAFLGILATCLRFGLRQFPHTYPAILAALGACCFLWVALDRIFKEQSFDAAMLLLFGVTIAMYAQLMLFNGGMTQLTGDQADYARLTPLHASNLLIWLALCVLPLMVWCALKKKKGEIRYEKMVAAVSAMFIGMQSVGLIATTFIAELPAGLDEDGRYLSLGAFTHLNADENIIVFLIDRLDVDYMSETLETFPELNRQLDGFSFYKNNISEYSRTFPSVCTMLTGHYYEYGQQFGEYWDQAWAGDTFLGKLKQAGFSMNLWIDFLSTYHRNSQIEDVADNLQKAEKSEVSPGGTLQLTARLSFGRVMPYFLKNAFLNGLDASFGSRYYKTLLPDGQEQENTGISSKGDIAFYRYISRFPVTADAGSKTFHFIHLNGPHTDFDKNVRAAGYHLNDATGDLEPEGNFIESNRACFHILDTYFQQMKSAGVYDNTTIILVGDHGAGFNPKEQKYRGMTTGLLIKPKQARGALKTDTTSELSNAYFGNSILDLAGLDYEGVSYFDIIEGKASAPPRRFYNTSDWWWVRNTTETLSLLEIYEITGDANNWKKWRLIDKREY